MSKATSYVVLGVAAFLVGGFSFRLVDHAGESKAGSNSTESKADSGEANAAVPRYFSIEGMTCQGCVDSITSALTQVPGVQSAKVSLQDKRAVVLAKESQVPTENPGCHCFGRLQRAVGFRSAECACHGCHFQQAAHFHQHHSGQERIACRFNGTWTRSIGHQGRQAGCCVPQCGCAGFCGKGFGR